MLSFAALSEIEVQMDQHQGNKGYLRVYSYHVTNADPPAKSHTLIAMFSGRQKECYFTGRYWVKSSADANWFCYLDFSKVMIFNGIMPVNSGLDPQLNFFLVKVSNISFNTFCIEKILSSTLPPYF